MTRARELGIPFVGEPGRYNAITDVSGVEVGHSTIIRDDLSSNDGTHSVRTGVTAILPRGKHYDPVFASWYSFNGCGELTGTAWLEESGFLESGIALTNTASVGVVHDAAIAWASQNIQFSFSEIRDVFWFLPVVGETNDMVLNDVSGAHIKESHVFEAFTTAAGGAVAEGNVGGGTGMVCYEFKGGIGTSSRKLAPEEGGYTVGVLVQSNYGVREDLLIAGVPVGREMTDLMPEIHWERPQERGSGSIIGVVATDAPLLPHQLKRLAKRVPLGIGRLGGVGTNSSGDLFIAFSTANADATRQPGPLRAEYLPNRDMNALFEATIHATEEAIVNALTSAQTMTGAYGNKVYALPHDRLVDILRKHNRLDQHHSAGSAKGE